MREQNTAHGSVLGQGDWSLIPPGSEDFTVYGGPEVVERARAWAADRQLLLYRGPASSCVHGLYRMDSCTFRICNAVGLDHTRIWVQHDARGAFILTHPYAEEIPNSISLYGEMHGLKVESWPIDGWYGHTTLPIRLALPDSWPLWPIERDAALLLHTQPVTWE